jgi:antitoxin MazE
VSVQDASVLVRAVGKPKLTLAQKLEAFDPALHGGEAIATGRMGKEVF